MRSRAARAVTERAVAGSISVLAASLAYLSSEDSTFVSRRRRDVIMGCFERGAFGKITTSYDPLPVQQVSVTPERRLTVRARTKSRSERRFRYGRS